eukprot:COSAG01_NODE_957_length_12474_cov_44.298182_5_plen_91_part_00
MAHQSALQLHPTQARTQTHAEACEWAMACAHASELDERRPAGDIAGERNAAGQVSAYTQDQFHSLYARSSRAHGPQDIKRALEATEETEA